MAKHSRIAGDSGVTATPLIPSPKNKAVRDIVRIEVYDGSPEIVMVPHQPSSFDLRKEHSDVRVCPTKYNLFGGNIGDIPLHKAFLHAGMREKSSGAELLLHDIWCNKFEIKGTERRALD